MKIYSEVGEGTTVKIYLPRLAAVAVVLEQQGDSAIPGGDREETILVVEDDDDVRTNSVERNFFETSATGSSRRATAPRPSGSWSARRVWTFCSATWCSLAA